MHVSANEYLNKTKNFFPIKDACPAQIGHIFSNLSIKKLQSNLHKIHFILIDRWSINNSAKSLE